VSAPTLPGRSPAAGSGEKPESRLTWLRTWLAHPIAPYYLLIGSAGLLLAIGLVMVLSASGVAALRDYDDSFYYLKRQVMFGVVGLVTAAVLARTPMRVIRASAWPLMLASVFLLLLTYIPGLGVEVNGSTNWLDFGGPFRIQPSEIAKLALVIWGAHIYAAKGPLLREIRHIVVPVFLGAGVVIGLTVGQKDLGTAIVLGAILLGLLWVVGVPGWLMALLGGGAVMLGGMLALREDYRRERLTSFINPFADQLDTGYQGSASLSAFASGGWWGSGLGASTQKWGRLPEAHTDFIYAVIGEELGLFGSLAVLVLLLVLAYAGLRIASRATNRFVQLTVTGVMTWMLVQSVINLGATLSVMPITGVPLPLVSYGGSALVIGLAGLGVVLAGARTDPAVRAALAARRGRSPAARGR
jgi:cell division protein FtsW